MGLSLSAEASLMRQAKARAQKTERLSGSEKYQVYKLKGRVCEISGEPIPRGKSQIAHNRPVAAGGKKQLRNLSVLRDDVHSLTHSVADNQRRREDRHGKLRYDERWGDITESVHNTALELTRASRIQAGEDPRSVYAAEYQKDPETRARIDDHLNSLEG